ncbi:hypothetical protein KCG44_06615 [Pacificimonas sp. WHA3]|uniref:Uncharacterized protein n=1 Tax=Pacificimonas pallii TaxID=2827236 RepID=A0ABS6SF20_9SPHN|nr:hypothetical protein [Pacificimonas pallii]MBV7256457.1 hypothetical protein [Pacificimonas pallii]
MEPPSDECCDGDGGREGFDIAIAPACYALPVLEAAEHALDDIALAIDLPVVLDLNLAIGF